MCVLSDKIWAARVSIQKVSAWAEFFSFLLSFLPSTFYFFFLSLLLHLLYFSKNLGFAFILDTYSLRLRNTGASPNWFLADQNSCKKEGWVWKKETRISWNRMASICIRVTFWQLSSDNPLQIQHIMDRQNALLGWRLHNHPTSKIVRAGGDTELLIMGVSSYL